MTPEQIKQLAIECGAVFGLKTMTCTSADAIVFMPDELEAYTKKVEEKYSSALWVALAALKESSPCAEELCKQVQSEAIRLAIKAVEEVLNIPSDGKMTPEEIKQLVECGNFCEACARRDEKIKELEAFTKKVEENLRKELSLKIKTDAVQNYLFTTRDISHPVNAYHNAMIDIANQIWVPE